MFVGHEARLDLALGVAQARLASLIRCSTLVWASEDTYGEGVEGLMRVGPVGSAPGLSRLVHVRFLDLLTHDDVVSVPLQWEAAGQGGGLFPALDANITLRPAGDHATLLRVDGVYRPPLGMVGAALDRAVLHRVAAATIRSFTGRVAKAILNPATQGEQRARERDLAMEIEQLGAEPSDP